MPPTTTDIRNWVADHLVTVSWVVGCILILTLVTLVKEIVLNG